LVPSEADMAGLLIEPQMLTGATAIDPTNARNGAALALAVSLPGSRDPLMKEPEGTTEKRS
jgi:hypothetical protein